MTTLLVPRINVQSSNIMPEYPAAADKNKVIDCKLRLVGILTTKNDINIESAINIYRCL